MLYLRLDLADSLFNADIGDFNESILGILVGCNGAGSITECAPPPLPSLLRFGQEN